MVGLPGPTGGKAAHLNNVHTLTTLCLHVEKPQLGVQQDVPNFNIGPVRISRAANDSSRQFLLLFAHTNTHSLKTHADTHRWFKRISWPKQDLDSLTHWDVFQPNSMLNLCAATIGVLIWVRYVRTWLIPVRKGNDSYSDGSRIFTSYTRAPIDFQCRPWAPLGFKSTISEQRTFNLKLMKFKIKTTFLWIDLYCHN